LGKALFFDTSLSGHGNMSCATCHDPAHAYGPPNSLAVQLGSDPTRSGTRAVPSLRYKSMTPPYTDNALNPDGISVNAPGGGFMQDGRAKTLASQTALPLLNPLEMDNPSRASVVAAVKNGALAAQFKQVYGAEIFSDEAASFDNVGDALQAFQREDESFHPYTSKYDRAARSEPGVTLTAAEKRGLRLFNDTETGAGCVACHFAGANFQASDGLMTDFTYQAIGAPRNPDIPANADPAYYDMGLCGPDNTLHLPGTGTSGHTTSETGVDVPDPYCGRFKVPPLRNVATRTTFFHNGVFHSLTQVLHFYNTRDTHPEYWYPSHGGNGVPVDNPGYALQATYTPGATIDVFNDLPVEFRGNIDEELPFGQGGTPMGGTTAADGALPRPFHSQPIMTDQDIADVECFLKTLTDEDQVPKTPATDCVD